MQCNRCGAALPNNSYVCKQCGALMTKEQIELQKKFNKENNLNQYNGRTNAYLTNQINYEKHETNYNHLMAVIFLILMVIVVLMIIVYLIC